MAVKNICRVSELRPSWAHTITPGVVIDHHRQVAVPLAVGDFVDPDAPQPFQLIDPPARSVTTRVTTAATVSAVESVMRKMLESHDLRAQARANNKQDFFVGSDLWYALERLAADRSRQQILDIFAMMPLWETLRELA
jgi:hypothetical protein